jgi:ATP-dependent DNA ligase
VTSVDVAEAYDRAMDAAARLNRVDDVTKRIRQLVEASDNASVRFVREAVQGRMRVSV